MSGMTGEELERYDPETTGPDLIAAEHQARYRMALPHVRGKAVLDAGCGVGWAAELLLASGARTVTGVDIAPEAIAAAQARQTAATFVIGDFVELPFGDDSFDIVVCFEALEHVHDTGRALDEFVRVLRPDGVLFVSSPNPAVYPPGNPFHLHELTPEELCDGVAGRLSHFALYRQHLFVSSVVLPDSGQGDSDAIDVAMFAVDRVEPGHDPYAVVVASSGDLPVVAGVAVIAPSHQLTNLDALAAALTVERAEIHADHERIVAERTRLLAENASLRTELHDAATRLVDADAGLRRLTEQVHVADSVIRELMAERDGAVDRANSAAQGLSRLSSLLERTAAERDRFGAALVEVEQDLAVQRTDTSKTELTQLRAQLERTVDECDEALSGLIEMQHTVSWRVTGPLRRVRTHIGGRP